MFIEYTTTDTSHSCGTGRNTQLFGAARASVGFVQHSEFYPKWERVLDFFFKAAGLEVSGCMQFQLRYIHLSLVTVMTSSQYTL